MDDVPRSGALTTLLALAVSAVVGSGCQGGKEEKPDQGRNVTRPFVTAEEPVSYAIYDQACIQDRSPVALNATGVWGWEGLGIVDALTPLTGTSTQETLQSDIVGETRYGRRYIRKCNGPSELNCFDSDGRAIGWAFPSESNPLRLCEDEFTYPRDTYEAAGVSATHFLNEAATVYRDAIGKDLRKISLEVFPLFESQFFDRTDEAGNKYNAKEYLTDNLAYYPGHDMIVMFPQSKAAEKIDLDKFWESSFVLAHELGHHVEDVLIGNATRQAGLKWDPTLHAYRSLLPGLNDNGEEQFIRAKYWTSISEAFADLNAYYSVKEDLSSLVNVDCLGANRNLENRVFADEETLKQLTEENVDYLISGSRFTSFCNGVNLWEPHTIGAIVAHNMKSIIDIIAPGGPNVSRDKLIRDRYRLTMQWLTEMAAAEQRLSGRVSTANELYQPLSEAIEALAEPSSNAVKTQICEYAQENLPVLNPAPLASYCQG